MNEISAKHPYLSRKFLALLLGIATTLLSARFPDQQESVNNIAMMVGAYIGVQGAVDFTNAKKVATGDDGAK